MLVRYHKTQTYAKYDIHDVKYVISSISNKQILNLDQGRAEDLVIIFPYYWL